MPDQQQRSLNTHRPTQLRCAVEHEGEAPRPRATNLLQRGAIIPPRLITQRLHLSMRVQRNYKAIAINPNQDSVPLVRPFYPWPRLVNDRACGRACGGCEQGAVWKQGMFILLFLAPPGSASCFLNQRFLLYFLFLIRVLIYSKLPRESFSPVTTALLLLVLAVVVVSCLQGTFPLSLPSRTLLGRPLRPATWVRCRPRRGAKMAVQLRRFHALLPAAGGGAAPAMSRHGCDLRWH